MHCSAAVRLNSAEDIWGDYGDDKREKAM